MNLPLRMISTGAAARRTGCAGCAGGQLGRELAEDMADIPRGLLEDMFDAMGLAKKPFRNVFSMFFKKIHKQILVNIFVCSILLLSSKGLLRLMLCSCHIQHF